MAEARKRDPQFTTPIATFKWPKLNKPDYGTDAFPKPGGEYSTKLVFNAADPAVQAFLARLAPMHAACVAEGREKWKEMKPELRKKLKEMSVNELYAECLDPKTEEPTGEIEIKVAKKASGEFAKGPKAGQRWNAVLPLFDAKGTPLRNAPDIWGGTTGKATVSVRGYFLAGTGTAGLKLSLEAAQIIELVQGGERAASAYGFGAEDGYEASDDATTSSPAPDRADAPHTDDADF